MRKTSVWGLALLAGAASVMLFAEPAEAQGRRGGISIGVGGGGIRFGTGGGNWGNPGWGNPGWGNSGSGWWGPGYSGSGFRIGIGPGYTNRPFGYNRPYYFDDGSYYSTPSYVAPYYSGSPSYYSDGSYESSEPMGTLKVEVQVPRADARVTFDGVTSDRNAKIRHFETSYMAPGRPYRFHVEATWMEGGREVRREKTITGYAGQSLVVDFDRATDTTGRSPGLAPVDPDRTTVPPAGTDRTPAIDRDRLPGTDVDRTPVVPDRTPGGSDRIPPRDVDDPRDPLPRDRD